MSEGTVYDRSEYRNPMLLECKQLKNLKFLLVHMRASIPPLPALPQDYIIIDPSTSTKI